MLFSANKHQNVAAGIMQQGTKEWNEKKQNRRTFNTRQTIHHNAKRKETQQGSKTWD